MSYTIFEDGHISSPEGFRSTGVASGLKEVKKARDLALVYSQKPCKVAAMFTTSATIGASVFFDQAILARNRENIRAVLINAGHANAGTGQLGLANAVECAKVVADELEVPRDSVLLMSTGMIGVQLPMDKIIDGIKRAVSELDSGGGRRAALAMLTTDTRPKERVFRIQLRDGHSVMLAGMTKGTRMVHPRLATLLCLMTTDLAIDQRLLTRSLQQSVASSFSRLTIDGDTAPNDTILLMANGSATGAPIVDASSWEYGAWQEALDALTADLAQQIIRDAAGSGKIIQVVTRGATSEAHARQVAQAVARSTTVRHSCMQGRPDWGALLAAVGASGAELRPELLELRVGSLLMMLEGGAVSFDYNTALQLFSGPEIELVIDLHLGSSAAIVWTCTWHSE